MIIPFVQVYTAGVTDIEYIDELLGFLFVANGFLYNIKTPQGMLVLSAGLYKETRYRSLAQSLIIIGAAVPLAFLYGVKGVMLGLLASNVYRAVDLLFFIPKYVTKLSVMNTFKKWIVMFISFACVLGVFEIISISVN